MLKGSSAAHAGNERGHDDKEAPELKPKATPKDEQLRLSEERNARLQAFINHSPSLMFIKDLQGRYLYVNERFTQAFGLERKDIVSHTDAEIFPAEIAAQFRTNDAKVLAGGVGIEVEEIARYGDGLLHTSIVQKFPSARRPGQVTALGGIVTDITERKRLEEMVRQKNFNSAEPSKRRRRFGNARSISTSRYPRPANRGSQPCAPGSARGACHRGFPAIRPPARLALHRS